MIYNEFIKSYLDCPYKLYLKHQSIVGHSNIYLEYYARLAISIKADVINRKYRNLKNVSENTDIDYDTIINNDYIINGYIKQTDYELQFDIVEIQRNIDGKNIVIPIFISEKEFISRNQKLFIAIITMKAEELLNNSITIGKIINGYQHKHSKIILNNYKKEAFAAWKNIQQIVANNLIPEFRRNKHCQICEYDVICKNHAIETDDLSLLSGMSPKEIKKWKNKGISSINQLAFNFKPRRKRKQNINYHQKNIVELKALAIREDKIYVYETPDNIQKTSVEIFWDIEGIPEIKSYYLIGILVVKNNETKKYQFWAENKEKEIEIFYEFLEIVESYHDYQLFHYGTYEVQYLKYMKQKVEKLEHKILIDELIEHSVNVLTYFNYNIYLPIYSNGLKEVGQYIGLKWSDKEVSGINSIVLRKEWETTGNLILKDRLMQYNYEDCFNLQGAKQFLTRIIENKTKNLEFPFKIEYEKAHEQNTTFAILNKVFADPNIESINNCSYFDYQIDRVHIRENTRRKKAKLSTKKFNGSTNQKINIEANKCNFCYRKTIGRISNVKTKKVLDIKFFKAGVKKWITKYISYEYYCSNCSNSFIPRKFSSIREHYGHSLKCYVIYQNFVNLLSFEKIVKNIAELFQLYLEKATAHNFKEYFRSYYEETQKNLLKKIINSSVIYVDETPFKLLSGEVYAWIFTNGQEVVSIFKPTRKGDFLKELLKDFKGVLVSDFFSAYSSLECRQQKCLIHLMRDFNDDLLKNPYDSELKQITQRFTMLLKAIVKTIDKKGFDKSYLIKFKAEVNQFFDFVENTTFHSEAAIKYKERLMKNSDKLFTFIEFDDVSWNNTFAEHAIKLMAVHRNKNIKFFKETRMEDYLLIMSLYQTSVYKSFDFLRFLLSKETDVDNYCEKEKGTIITT